MNDREKERSFFQTVNDGCDWIEGQLIGGFAGFEGGFADGGEGDGPGAAEGREGGRDLFAAGVQGDEVDFVAGEALVYHRVGLVRIGNVFPVAGVAHGRGVLAERQDLADVIQQGVRVGVLGLDGERTVIGVDGKEEVFWLAGREAGVFAIGPLHGCAGAGALVDEAGGEDFA